MTRRMLVLFLKDKDRDLPIAIYPKGLVPGLLKRHLKIARDKGLPAFRYHLMPLPLLYANGTLYLPTDLHAPPNVPRRIVRQPLLLI